MSASEEQVEAGQRWRRTDGSGEGKTPKAALRALKRRISDTIYRHLVADAQRARH
jgi:hypothetical protein